MNWVLLISIAIQTLALAWSVKSLQRLREWRLAFLSLMLGLMALRRGLAWFQPGTESKSQQWDEVPALVISVMSVLAVIFLERLLGELQQARQTSERVNVELAERERRLQAIIETEPECVKLLEPNGTLLQMNPAGLRMIEADSLDQIVGLTLLDLVLPKYRAAFSELTKHVLKGGTESLEFEIQGLRGTRRWLETHAAPYRDAAGQITSMLGVTRDITERKRAEEALRESEGRLQLLVQASNVGLWDWNLITNELFFSPEWKRQLGYSDNELPNRFEEWEQRVHPEDLAGTLAAVSDFRAGQRDNYEVEFRMRHKDGSWRWILTRADLRHDAAGRPIRMMGCHVDITERKQAEETLRQSEEFNRRIVESSYDCIKVLDLDGNLLSMSEGGQRLLGITDITLYLNQSWIGFWKESDQPQVREAVAAGRAGNIGHFQAFCPSATGKPRWWDVIVSAIRDAAGQPRQLLSISRDITERKLSEELLRESQAMLELVLDSIPQGVFWKDLHSVYRGANRVARRAMGFENSQAVVGRTDFDVPTFQREQAEFFVLKDRQVMQSGQSEFGIVETLTLSDSTTIWLETNKMPMRDSAGNITGVLGTWQDISERKRATEELSASRERLELLSRQLIAAQETERRHLARELHDEIGQALTSIKLNLNALQQATMSSEATSLIHNSIDVVDQTLQQVRNLALDLRPSMLDDIGLVAALNWCLDRQSQRGGFAPHFVVDPSVCGASQEIETACFRIAQESLTNIARHAKARNVRVELRQLESELELFIQDDGIGFDVPAARNRASHGASIGLLGMSERTQLLGGHFEIESIPSQGTTIHARIPLKTEST